MRSLTFPTTGHAGIGLREAAGFGIAVELEVRLPVRDQAVRTGRRRADSPVDRYYRGGVFLAASCRMFRGTWYKNKLIGMRGG